MEQRDTDHEIQELLQKLDKAKDWSGYELCFYNGFWLHTIFFQSIMLCRKYLKTDESHLILATLPKSGTTWMKALLFSILNRHNSVLSQSPLSTSNPHALVPSLEINIYPDLIDRKTSPENASIPRVSSTHIPYQLLPDDILESGCRIIYVCRNPLDHFVSLWHFMGGAGGGADSVSIEEAFDMHCRGVHGYGPFWEHVEGYWNAHLKNPDRILFLTYEDLKRDVRSNIKKMAEFMGCRISPEEEDGGTVERIAEMCSFKSLKSMEVNTAAENYTGGFKNSSFFRKGEVGDYANHLTPSMAERLEKIMETKMEGSRSFIINLQ